MRLLASDLLAQKSTHMQDGRGEAIRSEQIFNFIQAKGVNVIIVQRTHDVLGNFVQLKKTRANRMARDPADFPNRGLETCQREVFEQIVKEAEIKRPVRRADFKHIADLEAGVGKEDASVLDIFIAKINARVIKELGYPKSEEKPVIVGGTAGNLEDLDAWCRKRNCRCANAIWCLNLLPETKERIQ